MTIKHQGSANNEARERFERLPQVEIESGKNLFDLYIDSALCFETAEWDHLSYVRRMNWIHMAKRIAAGCLQSKRGQNDWYKS